MQKKESNIKDVQRAEFDHIVEALQEEIDQKDRDDFSAYALELAKHPYHYGSLPAADDVFSCAWRGPCGDMMKIYLKIVKEYIVDARFEVDGCATSVIAGSQTMKMIMQQPVKVAEKLEDQAVIKALGKFPSESHHCCTLAVTTLKKTLTLYTKRTY